MKSTCYMISKRKLTDYTGILHTLEKEYYRYIVDDT